MILDIAAVAVLSLICVFLVIVILQQRKTRKELTEKYLKAEIEKSVVLEKLQDVLKELEAKGIEESDGFLKFISESRDWAFKYIEDVQGALSEFEAKASPYFENKAVSDKEALLAIRAEYDKLRQMLPNDMVN
jgi:hypothetical protein